MTPREAAQLYRNQGVHIPPEISDLAEPGKRLEKYGRIKKEIDGHVFDSVLEADAYVLLKLWEMGGTIRDLVLQPVYELVPKRSECVTKPSGRQAMRVVSRAVKYIPDFRFEEHQQEGYSSGRRFWQTVVVDAKGVQTQAFVIKAKLFRERYPWIDLQVWDRARVKELTRL